MTVLNRSRGQEGRFCSGFGALGTERIIHCNGQLDPSPALNHITRRFSWATGLGGFFEAHRAFIISDSRFLPAAVRGQNPISAADSQLGRAGVPCPSA
jgi:hypothetical protein